MPDAPKIIVLGSLNGQIEPALKKLATLQAKNNFTLALLVGDVFSSSTDDSLIDSLLNGTIEVALPTYFTVGIHPLPPRIAAKVEADEEICPNLHFLGKRSVTKTSEGLRIVALGGQLDPNLIAGQSAEQHLPFHTNDDAKALKGAHAADILLTSAWPAGVWSGSKNVLEAGQQAALKTTDAIAELCSTLKPRYHFSASPEAFFYEREPFVHLAEGDSNAVMVTRFISLAPFGNEAKQKAMYALTLNKSDTSIPAGATPTPFRPREARQPKGNDDYNRYGKRRHEDDHHHHRNHRSKRRRSPPPGPDRCFFCLSNANLSEHMVCAIGSEAYLTTAKGPLTTPTTFAAEGLDFPGQLIIIPFPHAPTIPRMNAASAGDDADNDPVKIYNEMTRFREAVQATIASRSSHKLGVVTYEISRARNVHLIWQAHALPADKIRGGLAEAAFRVEAENCRYPPFETKELSVAEQLSPGGGGDFFRVWLWADDGEDKIQGTSLVMPLPEGAHFDLLFGRRVLAKLMGLEDRMAWRDCDQGVPQEVKDAEAFKKAFAEWDWTLAEGE